MLIYQNPNLGKLTPGEVVVAVIQILFSDDLNKKEDL